MADYKDYFDDQLELLESLEALHFKKVELKKQIETLRGACQEPFVVELSGLPRTGKTSCMQRVYDFFKAGNIAVQRTMEPAYLIKQNLSLKEIRQMSNLEFNDRALQVSKESLAAAKESNPDIILMDRGIVDNYFWYQMLFNEGKIDIDVYEQKLLTLASDLLKIDQLFVLVAAPKVTILRDYINQIYLEDRVKTTLERVQNLKYGFEQLLPSIREKIDSKREVVELDTSSLSEMDTAVFVADKIMDGMNRKIK